MAGADARVGIHFIGIDDVTSVVKNIDQNITKLTKSFGAMHGFMGKVFAGLQWHLVYNTIRTIENAIEGVANVIPDLIGRGQEWARVVDDISDATGMNARQSSELAAVQIFLGGSTESLGKAMVQLSKNARMHEDVLKEMGVATRNAHGGFLSIYTILQNLRNAYSSTADGATRFGRAYQQLGRGTREVTDLLALNAMQYAALADQAQRAGLIMNASMARNAETLRRTQGILEGTLTGIGNQILGGVAPVLTALINGISKAIQDNLANIVRFAVQVVNTIAGLIGGLFGISFQLIEIKGQFSGVGDKATKAGDGLSNFGKGAKDAASGADAGSKAIQRQIDAIDRQLKALDKQEKREKAKEEHQSLMTEIREAKAELADIRSQTIFAAGMSDAEAELARQAQASQVKDGIKNVKDAEEALRKWRRDQARDHQREMLQMQRDALQEQLSAMKSAGAAMAGAAAATGGLIGKNIGKGLGKGLGDQIQKGLMGVGQASLLNGMEMARQLKDLIFGPERVLVSTGGVIPMGRSGGIVTFLQDAGKAVGDFGHFIVDTINYIKKLFPDITGVGKEAPNMLLGLGGLIGNMFGTNVTTPPPASETVASGEWDALIAKAHAANMRYYAGSAGGMGPGGLGGESWSDIFKNIFDPADVGLGVSRGLTSANIPGLLQNIDTSLIGIRAAIGGNEPFVPPGGEGGGTQPTITLAQETKMRINGDKNLGLADTRLKGLINQEKRTRVNSDRNLNTQLRSKVSVDRWWDVRTDDHQDYLKLRGGYVLPMWRLMISHGWIGGGSFPENVRTARTASTGGDIRITLKLDPQATRRLLSGREATTTTRPATNT